MNIAATCLQALRANADSILLRQPASAETAADEPIVWRGAELERQAATAQQRLRALGLAAGQRVVLVAPNSVQWVAADLAIVASGAVCVPLYDRQPAAELRTSIDGCQPSLVFCASVSLLEGLRSAGIACQALSALFAAEAEALALEVVNTSPQSLATLIYTSGTSGEAKAVMLSHGNLEAMLRITCNALDGLRAAPAGEKERAFHYLPFCFAGSRLALWSCLRRGVELSLCSDLSALVPQCAAARPHWMLNVPLVLERLKSGAEQPLQRLPSLLRWLLRPLLGRMLMRRLGGSLRCLLSGSAPLSPDTQRWFGALGRPVYQIYGLTETTGIVSLDPTDRPPTPGQVGVVVPGCEARLGDRDELLVRGPHVFAGYWQRPEATRAVLDDEGWFHTGDRARLDEQGRLTLLGRVKNTLVLTSGHNVTPEPIEAQLDGISGIEHAMVVGHGRPHVATLLSGRAPCVTELAAAVERLNATLPHYGRIRAFHVVDEAWSSDNGLLTANQKLRRHAVEERYRKQIASLFADPVP